ncbi:MAG: HAMP domain-containing protein [Nitrospirae bacterium]|nr:HAMP domain-containing protein [Nitrospirota bacterium]
MLRVAGKTLSRKITLSIAVLMIIGGAMFWYKFTNKVNNELYTKAVEDGFFYIEAVRAAIAIDADGKHNETVTKVTSMVGASRGVPAIRVLDHNGNIKFSSDKNELNNTAATNSPLCNECHTIGSTGSVKLKDITQNRFLEHESDKKTLRATLPIKNDQTCMTAQCHVHNNKSTINGFVDVRIDLNPAAEKARENTTDIAIMGIFFIALATTILHLLVSKFVVKPVALVREGIKMVKSGYFGHTLDFQSGDEIGALSGSFNEMTRSLQDNRDDFEEKTRALSGIMEQKAKEMRKFQEQYVHTEKLASLGRMAASVAHELNSPLTGIIVFAQLLLKRIPESNKLDKEDLSVIIEQAEKCSNMIAVLLGYSRTIPSEKLDMDVTKALENALNILTSQSKFYNVTIEKELTQDIPRLPGDQSQLEQVFINLLINANDAMNSAGTIFIKTNRIEEDSRQFVEIEVTDSGPGILPENMDKIFEPFFTTKPEGKGTGLGLAVTKGITEKLGGRISVKQQPASGASFIIRLPVAG